MSLGSSLGATKAAVIEVVASLAAEIAAVNSGGVTGELRTEYRGHRNILSGDH